MSDQARFTDAEEAQIRADAVAGTPPHCPRCGVQMTWRSIGGGSFGLGYARQRDWYLCPVCRRSALFDRKRGTRT